MWTLFIRDQTDHVSAYCEHSLVLPDVQTLGSHWFPVILRSKAALSVRSELLQVIIGEHNSLKLDSDCQNYYESSSGSSFILFDL